MSDQEHKPNQESTASVAKVYPSAVDLWVPLLLLMTPAVAVVVGVILLRQGRAGDAITFFLMGAGFLLLTGMFTFPCRYTVLPDSLSIRCGMLCYHLPYDQIESVESSASLRSGPALSTRRIRVVTKKRSYLISPKNRDEFITVLKNRMRG